MARLPRLLSRTYTPRVLRLDGGFAGLFQLDFASALFARRYEDPVLVSCTDGVGTKLKVAAMMGVHNTVGIDLVAMSVNDALCLGAEPLFFLDYVAMPKDDPPLLEQIVEGITAGCLESDCACWAAKRRSCPTCTPRATTTWPAFAWAWSSGAASSTARRSPPATWCIGVASSGLHSNGYSLARKVVFDVGRPEGRRPRAGTGRDGGRGPADADADLRPAAAQRAGRTTA